METIERPRSPYQLVGGLAHFGRMVDKIRLHAAGRLAAENIPFLGDPDPTCFDGRVCRFLGVTYPQMVERTLAGGTDPELFDWAMATGGRHRTEEEIFIMSAFLAKRGWRDTGSEGLREWERESGLPAFFAVTYFDQIDYEEGREMRFSGDPA